MKLMIGTLWLLLALAGSIFDWNVLAVITALLLGNIWTASALK